jgi:hypothetical protein
VRKWAVTKPQLLRAYNELLHRVTASLPGQVLGVMGIPLEAVLQMMKDFGTQYAVTEEMDWVTKQAQELPLPVEH